jgi:hypothetical protein
VIPSARNTRVAARWSAAWVLLTAGCVGANPSAAGAPPARVSPAPDERAVAAVLDYLARNSEGRLFVDPRPLREGADLAGLETTDVSGDSAVSNATARILARRGIQVTDAASDMRCAFVRGAIPPPEVLDSEPEDFRRAREACLRRGLYTTVILGTPRRDEEGAARSVWIVRAVRMTTSSYGVWDLPVRVNARGAWEVLEPRRLFGVVS